MIPAVNVASFGTALIAALVLGLLNAVIRPVLLVLTLPVNVLTLGLFTFVINGFLFWLATRMLDGFEVRSFGWAILAAIVYSLISWAVSALVPGRRG
jgi:putative membrane protein